MKKVGFYHSCAYQGKVWHLREQGVRHEFSYPVYIWYLDLDELANPNRKYRRLISYEKFGLFSFYEKDHGKFDSAPISLREKLNKITSSHGLPQAKKIRLLTNLRILGYVFNPVSFYYLFDNKDKLFAVIAEVNNTFGEQKAYLLPWQEDKACKKIAKQFYVSPFIRHDSIFSFSVKEPKENLHIVVNTENQKGYELKALLTGHALPITTANIWRLFWSYPLLTLKIISWIHYQALKLFLKKLPYYKKAETDALIQQSKSLAKGDGI